MAGIDASKTDQRARINSLTLEGCKSVDIHHRMLAAYGDMDVSKPMVTRWSRMFGDSQHRRQGICRSHVKHTKL
ncbi:hypothetical protein TNCV_4683851 [Trichonephila clavipes]|nr:hypothetical protein TNCV_4683851 [Trichonephila clavipes]